MTPHIDPAEFRAAMRLTASGVAVITTDGPAGRAGLTVSTLCSLSMEPPSVVICVHRDARALAALAANEIFVANVLAHGQSAVADAFAGAVPEYRDNKFAAGSWHALDSGAPALRGALCAFDCRLAATFAFGSHRILVGQVTGLETQAGEPLMFSGRGYRQLAAA